LPLVKHVLAVQCMFRCCVSAWWATITAVSWQYVCTALCRWAVHWWQWSAHFCSHLPVNYNHRHSLIHFQ